MPRPSTPDAAIVICAYTHDRWDDIVAAVASARAQEPSRGVLVVVDHEESLRRRLEDAGLGVRVAASAGPPGLSGARNTGVAATDAPVVAFLDDDARAQPGWLAGLLAPYEDPRVVATGGRVEPAFDAGRPRWLPDELDWIVGCTYRGMPERRSTVRNVIGAGMTIRRDALLASGGFNTGIGRTTGLPVGGEETAACIRARRHVPGGRVVLEPAVEVLHRVRPERATLRYALVRGWAEGVTKARVSQLEGPGDGLATERGYVARTLPAGVLRRLRDAVLRRDPWALARAGVITAVLAAAVGGYLAEHLRGRLEGGAPDPYSSADRTRAAGTSAGTRTGAAPRAPRPERPLRILEVTPRFAPYIGGVETHTEEVAGRLARRGHRVTVATTDPDGGLPALEWRDGVEVIRVRAWPTGSDWHFAPGLVPIIARRRWDVVHLQGVHTLVPPLGALAAILGGRRFVLTFHSGGHSSRLRTAARPLQWRLIAPLLRRAAVLVAVSRFEAERFASALEVPGDRIELIRNGSPAPAERGAGETEPWPAAGMADAACMGDAVGTADTPDAADAAEPEASAAGCTVEPGLFREIPADAPLILSPGRLERYKGHHRVIAAMPALRRLRPGVRLHVAGGGAYEPALRRQVEALGLQDAVTIGPVARASMPAAMRRAGVVTLLSEYEAHPVAVVEALAARRPVVVADSSGLRELADDGLARAVPLDATPDETAAAILEALDGAQPDAALHLPTWDDTTDALEALYRHVADA